MRPSRAVQKFPCPSRLPREGASEPPYLQVYDSSVPYESEARKRECRKLCASFGFGILDVRSRRKRECRKSAIQFLPNGQAEPGSTASATRLFIGARLTIRTASGARSAGASTGSSLTRR